VEKVLVTYKKRKVKSYSGKFQSWAIPRKSHGKRVRRENKKKKERSQTSRKVRRGLGRARWGEKNRGRPSRRAVQTTTDIFVVRKKKKTVSEGAGERNKEFRGKKERQDSVGWGKQKSSGGYKGKREHGGVCGGRTSTITWLW